MRIGIAKLNTKIEEIDAENDKNGRYTEVKMLLEAFNNYFFFTNTTIQLVDKDYFKNIGGYFDVIFILNNVLKDRFDYMYAFENLQIFRNNSVELNYIITDLRLIYNSEFINNYFTQTIEKINIIHGKNQFYSGMPELALLNYSEEYYKKDNDFIFGGGMRDREVDFNEYIYSFIIDKDWIEKAKLIKSEIYTKIKNYNESNKTYDNRIPLFYYYEELKRSKYSLIINDTSYNEAGFITWRFYENLKYDVISFFDNKVDKYNIINLPKYIKDFLIVNSVEELIRKMQLLNENNSFYKIILEANREYRRKFDKLGEYTVKSLLGIR